MAMQGIGVNVWANTAQFVEGINKAAGSLKSMEGMAKTAMTAIGGYLSIGVAKQFMEMGAKALQAEEAFRHTAASIKVDADKWIADMKRMSNSTADTSDMMQQAMKLVTGGMRQEDTVKLWEIARVSARRMGVDVVEAYNNIGDAILSGRTRMLKAYSLITPAQQEMIDKIKAAGIELDVMNVVIGNYNKQAAMMGEITENASERFQKNKAIVQSLKEEIGIGLVNALAEAAEGFKYFLTLGAFRNAHNAALSGDKRNLPNIAMMGGEFGEKTPNADDYLKGLMGRIPDKNAQKAADTIQKVIDNLQFEYEQLERNDAEQKIYNNLKAAGVDWNTKAGEKIAELTLLIWSETEALKEAEEAEEKRIKTLEEGAEALRKLYTDSQQEELDDFIRQSDEKKRIIAEFTDKRLQSITSELGYSIAKLNEEYAVYDKFIQDKTKLNEWYSAEVYKLAEEETERLNKAITDRWETEHEVMNAMREAWGLTYQEIQDGAVNSWTELGDTLVSISEQMSDTMSRVMVGFIDGTVNAREAVENLAKSILQNIIQALIKVGVQQVLLATIGNTIQMTSTAATVASMQAVYASASAAAAALSMATFGASAAAGSAAYMSGMGATMAFSQAMGAGLFGQPQGMAQGGVINEHIIGRGLQTGKYYELGEEGPERVTPLRGQSKSNITININGAVLNNYDELARVLVPAIRKAEYDGV